MRRRRTLNDQQVSDDQPATIEGTMLFESPDERQRAGALSRIIYCNPFLPERLVCEREALGEDFVDPDIAWNVGSRPLTGRANIVPLQRRAEEMAAAVRQRLAERKGAAAAATPQELAVYEDLVMYLLYYRNKEVFEQLILAQPKKLSQAGLAQAYDRFVA